MSVDSVNHDYVQRPEAGAARGFDWPDRLYPPKSSRIHHHLVSLRQALEAAIGEHVASHGSPVVLDYGCGEAPYRRLFEGLGARYLGFDLAGNAAADGVIAATGHLEREPESVDAVLSSQVLEHVPDPDLYLSESYRVLRPGGVLLLSTHGVWRYHPDPVDYWRWTGAGLRRTLRRPGFEVVSCTGVVGPAATGIQLWQDAVLPRVPSRLRRLFCYLCQGAMRRADRRCDPAERANDAQVFVCVARKELS